MNERYRIEVTKDYLVFSAGHFITLADDLCERLHGHNYRFAVEIDGPLDDNAYVVDFIFVRDAALEIARSLDHFMLLPTQSTLIHVEAFADAVEARFRDKVWRFPREDCVLLPLRNTTTELLARWIGKQMLGRLNAAGCRNLTRLAIRLEENFGQWATWEATLNDDNRQ